MTISTNLGFPRIGPNRETKKAVEAYWKKNIDEAALLAQTGGVREAGWTLQQAAGIQHIPSNDFTLYDHILDLMALTGAVPARYGWSGGEVDLDTYFAMARGAQGTTRDGKPRDVEAMEMTKWFDTNYHYIVPEFTRAQSFSLASQKPFLEFEQARRLGILTRPVLTGPLTYLRLGKVRGPAFDKLTLLDALLPVYEEALRRLHTLGAEWIQIDEPILVTDCSADELAALETTYARLRNAAGGTKLLLATYFGDPGEYLECMAALPVDGIHVDLVRAPQALDGALRAAGDGKVFSLGIVDGRNIWKNDLDASFSLAESVRNSIGNDRVFIAPSCSLLHTPIDLDAEKDLDPDLKGWLAFAKQKLQEISLLTRALTEGQGAVAAEMEENRKARKSRRQSPKIHRDAVQARAAQLTSADARRKSASSERRKRQRGKLNLPLFPSTTIGSFPQTPGIRQVRRAFKDGSITREAYTTSMQEEIRRAVRTQEEIGLDVLVHGEPERNDMVEYFGEQLEGFAFTRNGWVQSYGSRCVKPPVIFGDVSRPRPMTVEWARYAQSLTDKPMKGMLTGPVTILQWSFVRNDQPRRETATQIALAIRDETVDLEQAGIGIIQIDEPAIREGLPLRRGEWPAHLEWAVDVFRIASSAVEDQTQIHTHMCYSEFNDMIEAIAKMDADVITIEASRSSMELLDVFKQYRYPNEIGPGVYDIHSPRIPTGAEMEERLRDIVTVIPAERVWVNPDCGLKTRGWEETIPALRNMVAAAKRMRANAATSPRELETGGSTKTEK